MAKILLVEDNDLFRNGLIEFFELENYEVVWAVNGAEGVQRARETKPDLILMDLKLPLLDGWKATQLLKSDPETAAIPVVALTSLSPLRYYEQSIEAGVDGFEIKTISPSLLVKRVEHYLRQG